MRLNMCTDVCIHSVAYIPIKYHHFSISFDLDTEVAIVPNEQGPKILLKIVAKNFGTPTNKAQMTLGISQEAFQAKRQK